MNIIDIINKKEAKEELTLSEIKYIVDGFVSEDIKEYQMSSLLMTICINGMTDDEVIKFTDAMLNSGDKIDLSGINGIKVDKHSTGGVGDKTTLVLAPLVASVGVVVAKMSGRGLGHTGGTIDKLEAIKDFNVEIPHDKFVKQINDIGVAIVSQMGNLVPADKKLYALRDVTGTVESIPLIASSIMSKKLASGADKFVIDVKVGNGALVTSIEDARKLAKLMIKIGAHYKKEVVCVLTNIDEPLGNSIGNGLEVIESINTLKGDGPDDLKELVITLGSIMVSMAKNIDIIDAQKMVIENLENGKAYEKFEELVKYQNGDINNICISDKFISIKSPKSGFIKHIDALKLGELSRSIGAGRYTKEDKIDYGVGFKLAKKVGDFVMENEELIKVYLNEKDITASDILKCFEIDEIFDETPQLILEIIR